MADQYLRNTKLYVEGPDDWHVIAHLLKASGFQTENEPRDVELDVKAKVDHGHNRDRLLKLITTVVKASTGKAVAFVIDADDSASATWDAIRYRVEEATKDGSGNPQLPSVFPAEGLVVDLPSLKSRVGVWIMPDNGSIGILEDFLQKLVAAGDTLIPHAEASTDEATKLGAAFRAVARRKAVLHTWLAWQANPGCTYGVAIRSHYFDMNAPRAKAFIDWVKRLVD